MRLLTKLSIWYILIISFVLAFGGLITFRKVMNNVDHEAERKLNAWVNATAEQLEYGRGINELNINTNISVVEIGFSEPIIPLFQSDSTGIFPPRSRGDDRKLVIGKSIKTHGKHYLITAENFIAEPDEIEEGVQFSLVLIAIILIIFVGIVSVLISKIILKPFKTTLNAIDTFNLTELKPLQFPDIKTREFHSLNRFLEKMTKKAVDDYTSLKEFSENASHEIQTPLAIIRGKMELLTETNINEEQAAYINSIQNSVNKLSNINHSLALLTKLENQEYDKKESTDVSSILRNAFVNFQELLQMKNISVETDIQENVRLDINKFVADLLINNLVTNAVRHNVPDGIIRVALSPSRLVINNNGLVPGVSTNELFQRFKKSNQSSDSTGLGLSIVKKICDLHGYSINYFYSNSLHTVEIVF